MKLLKITVVIILVASVTSCAPLNPVARKDRSAPGRNSELAYQPYSHLSRKSPDELLRLLKIDSVRTDSVAIRFSENEMKVTFRDSRRKTPETHTFKGKMRKHDFQVFHNRKNIVFPPVYWLTNIDRLRFSISPDSSLVVTEYHNHSGMILLMSGGTSWENQHVYSKIKRR